VKDLIYHHIINLIGPCEMGNTWKFGWNQNFMKMINIEVESLQS
jgi:hypothetical protein